MSLSPAVGVHTTQFEIRKPAVGLLEPVLALAAEELDRADAARQGPPLVRIAGVCGRTPEAVAEASLIRRLGYHAGLVSAWRDSGTRTTTRSSLTATTTTSSSTS